MPEFFAPTRDTTLRNSYDISELIEENRKGTTKLLPKHPVYIISKGRWESRKTVKSLEKLNLPYRIVVEPQEFNNYASVISKDKILTLPFDNLGQGSIPARNWVWEHSIKEGHKKHWILDDNINGFGTQRYGRRVDTNCGDFFSLCEDFVDKFKNIALAGIRYRFHHNYCTSPYILNTRVYSCILIKNDTPMKWRGKYNEDTDLSLRCLKAGYCTVLFTWCYCNKSATLTMKGGNTDTIYNSGDMRKGFAESLKEQHPDIVKVVWRYNRWHHQVDYSGFKKNELRE